jgi:hypothetical protein
MSDQTESARTFIAGAFADFIIFLTALPDPIVIGGTYPRAKLIEAFSNWAKNRNFDTAGANINTWREACNKSQLTRKTH